MGTRFILVTALLYAVAFFPACGGGVRTSASKKAPTSGLPTAGVPSEIQSVDTSESVVAEEQTQSVREVRPPLAFKVMKNYDTGVAVMTSIHSNGAAMFTRCTQSASEDCQSRLVFVLTEKDGGYSPATLAGYVAKIQDDRKGVAEDQTKLSGVVERITAQDPEFIGKRIYARYETEQGGLLLEFMGGTYTRLTRFPTPMDVPRARAYHAFDDPGVPEKFELYALLSYVHGRAIGTIAAGSSPGHHCADPQSPPELCEQWMENSSK